MHMAKYSAMAPWLASAPKLPAGILPASAALHIPTDISVSFSAVAGDGFKPIRSDKHSDGRLQLDIGPNER